MNEFIVWDDNIKEFNSFSDDYSISQKGTISWQGRDGLEIEENCIVFQYIGLKDINDNKIYADSSIAEFIHKSIKQIGIVKYSIDYAYYYFDVKNGSGHIPLHMVNKSKIKIIDTVQENKLGLINE